MQITHETNGKDLPDYPQNLQVKDVNVFMHDSGMIATHDYSCPCCRKNHAILDLSCGLMKPCDACSNTYELVKKKPKKNWFYFLGIKT
jgi:hypothetical protein